MRKLEAVQVLCRYRVLLNMKIVSSYTFYIPCEYMILWLSLVIILTMCLWFRNTRIVVSVLRPC